MSRNYANRSVPLCPYFCETNYRRPRPVVEGMSISSWVWLLAGESSQTTGSRDESSGCPIELMGNPNGIRTRVTALERA